MSGRDKRVHTSFQASMNWAFKSLILVLIAILILFYSEYLLLQIIGFAVLLYGVFFAIQSFRQLKLFYPGAFLLTGGMYFIFLAPVFHRPIFALIVSLIKVAVQDKYAWVNKLAEKFPQIVPSEVTGVDGFIVATGLAVIGLGVAVYRTESSAKAEISEDLDKRVK